MRVAVAGVLSCRHNVRAVCVVRACRYKPLNVTPLPYNGSTLYIRNTTCDPTSCLVEASGTDECEER